MSNINIKADKATKYAWTIFEIFKKSKEFSEPIAESVRTHIMGAFLSGYDEARADLREEVASCKTKNWNDGFNDGYKKADKDLALTWEDVKLLSDIETTICNENLEGAINSVFDAKLEEKYYKEILRRFNEQREKK